MPRQISSIYDNFLRNKEVRCLDKEGRELGVIPFEDAFSRSTDAQLDLVEMSTGTPPVVKIMDYGKFLYEKKKRAKVSKKVSSKPKEIKLHVNISKGDLQTKIDKAKYFLGKNNKIKISLQYRGREMAHKSLGIDLIEEIIKNLSDYGKQEGAYAMQGRIVSTVISPNRR